MLPQPNQRTDSPQRSGVILPSAASLKTAEELFPLKNSEGLKVYAILSAHRSISENIGDSNIKLAILGAYTLDEALQSNSSYLQAALGDQMYMWKPGVMFASLGYENIVPITKMAEMIDKIKENESPRSDDLSAKRVQEMESYARYVFGQAGASSWEKGILTAVLGRFRAAMLKPVSLQKNP